MALSNESVSNRCKYAFLAGLVDGDGTMSIRFSPGKGYQFTLGVYSTSRTAMNWLVDIFGGQFRKLPTKGNRKQKYEWYTSSPSVLCEISPFLLIKRVQAVAAQNFFSLGSERNPEAREEIMREISAANKYYEPVAEKYEVSSHVEPTKEDWAYLAGLFDAEGSFEIHSKKGASGYTNFCSVARISNTDARIFPWLVERFGGNYHRNPRDTRDEGVWAIQEPRGKVGRKERERKFLAILPHLIIKRERAVLLLEWVRHCAEWSFIQKYECFKEMRRMNHRGKTQEANMSGLSVRGDKIESDLHGDMQCAPVVTLEA